MAREENLLPVGLSQGAVVTREIREGGLVTFDDVEVPDSEVLELRRIQDADAGGPSASS